MMLALCASLLTQTTESKLNVEAAAILVARDLGWAENEGGAFNENLPGTKIALLVSSAGPGLLKLEDRKSKIVSMKDDKGTDLLAAKPKKESVFARAGLSPFPKVAKDGKGCLVELRANGVPAPGARSILIEGSLVLLTAQGQETALLKDVELKKGAKIQAGGLEITVESAGKDGFDEQFPFQVALTCGQGGQSLAKVRFLDAAGKEIASKQGSTSRMSGFGGESWTWNYNLKSELKACAVEVALWKQLAEATVPFKLEVSLGL